MDQPRDPQNAPQRAPSLKITSPADEARRIRGLLNAAGYSGALVQDEGSDDATLVIDGRPAGEAPLGVVLGAVESLAEDVQSLIELEAIEKLASIGRFLIEPGGALRLSEEAARLLGDAIDVSEVCAQADSARRTALREWLVGEQELSSEIIEVTLTSPGGAPRRLRFIDGGDAQRRRGYVQAVEFLPARPPLDAAAPESDVPSVESRVRGAIAAARRHDRQLAVLAARVAAPEVEDESLARGLCTALQARFAGALRSEDVHGSLLELERADALQGEFLIAVELQNTEEVTVVARRLCDACTEPVGVSGRTLQVQARVGVALLGPDGSDADVLMAAARDSAERATSELGIGFASSTVHAELLRRSALEVELAEAIRAGQIVPFYQPKVDAATERVVGCEALARWIHPERGLVSPGEFIPLAESNGMIVDIGLAILQRACRDAVEWQKAGLQPIRVAVNLSAAQFVQPDLVETVVATLEETGLAPELLELELTESMLMDDAEAAVTILRRFERHGISLAIDDFGTGYSSLSYLRRLPIDALKIDRSFIDEVNVNPDDAAIATSIILLGRSLKLRVVAEGVETRKQLEFLRVMQCDEIQGFLYSKPVAPDQAVELFKSLGG